MALHVLVPLVAARIAFAERTLHAFAVMMLTMAVDLDHLLADPVFDPNRCSIGFHPLHSTAACVCYGVLTLVPRTRLVGLGLGIHMLLDGIDCIWMRASF